MDRSNASEFVFDRAIAIAQKTGAHLKLLHVLSEKGESAQQQEPALCTYTFVKGANAVTLLKSEGSLCAQQEPLELLLGCVERATALRLEAEFTLTVGDPAQVICNTALAWHADLILMGGKPDQAEPFPGSIS
ncbi:MAG: universal stress protein [Acaryochloridaceae cyanobacterium CSU_5_19]|nr:universal stress protein [Acaryochloridaceae cyanobacterium CSU_5_19]